MLRLSGFELYSRWVPLFYDVPLLKMYRLSTKSLEEQKHPWPGFYGDFDYGHLLDPVQRIR